MRSAIVVVVVAAACSGSHPGLGADANGDVPGDAQPYEFEHQTTDVLVTPMSVHWSEGDFVCGLESCPAETSGAVLSFTQRNTVTAYVPYELDVAQVGSRQLAGDDQQLFYTVGTGLDSMFVKRCDAGDCTALSIPRRLDIGPAVDASDVYWADTLDGMTYTLRRASRGGDGTDATVVVPMIDVGDPARARLLEAGAQLWWIGKQNLLMHAPVTGGTPVSALDQADYIAASGDLVLVSRLVGLGTAQVHDEIGTLGTDGIYRPVTSFDDGRSVVFLTAAENAVWWSTGDGNIYSVPMTGGAVTTHAVAMASSAQVFAVLPDRFLVDLTAHDLRSVLR